MPNWGVWEDPAWDSWSGVRRQCQHCAMRIARRPSRFLQRRMRRLHRLEPGYLCLNIGYTMGIPSISLLEHSGKIVLVLQPMDWMVPHFQNPICVRSSRAPLDGFEYAPQASPFHPFKNSMISIDRPANELGGSWTHQWIIYYYIVYIHLICYIILHNTILVLYQYYINTILILY